MTESIAEKDRKLARERIACKEEKDIQATYNGEPVEGRNHKQAKQEATATRWMVCWKERTFFSFFILSSESQLSSLSSLSFFLSLSLSFAKYGIKAKSIHYYVLCCNLLFWKESQAHLFLMSLLRERESRVNESQGKSLFSPPPSLFFSFTLSLLSLSV